MSIEFLTGLSKERNVGFIIASSLISCIITDGLALAAIQDRDRFHNDFLVAENILGRDFSVQTLLLIGSTVSLAEHLMH
jgi:hypothetical protein